MTNHQADKFIPALGNDLLTPLYDPLLWFMRERRFKTELVEQAQITNGSRVLDVGCGTGTLAIMIKKLHYQAEVIGIDADSKILGIARAKAAKAGVKLTFDQGMADQLPYADSSFERVLSSLFLHHRSEPATGKWAQIIITDQLGGSLCLPPARERSLLALRIREK